MVRTYKAEALLGCQLSVAEVILAVIWSKRYDVATTSQARSAIFLPIDKNENFQIQFYLFHSPLGCFMLFDNWQVTID